MKGKSANFQRRVLAVVAKIPRGQVSTYKEIARRAGNRLAYRAVGNILKKNHDPKIPCHRVIRSDGMAGGYNRGARRKIEILKKDGVLLK
ncbi:MAG: MGMT family protein [Patescibacteria group bacterium]|nr:MGMT family protein [Patescibacteria group bacterium]MDE2015779.1 MGMT family protein [Patescibacteria group bacterium]MDE2226836.1 MGMT family protein [Patescibacteria group bacterium]